MRPAENELSILHPIFYFIQHQDLFKHSFQVLQSPQPNASLGQWSLTKCYFRKAFLALLDLDNLLQSRVSVFLCGDK